MAISTDSALAKPVQARQTLGRYFRVLGRFMRTKPLGSAGLIIVVFAIVVSASADLVAPHDPFDVSARRVLLAPQAAHWFGTDQLGRDLLSRVIFGARVSILVGVSSMLIASVIGSAIGVSTAYFAGKYDLIVQRFVDALTAFPSLLLALALMAAFGASFTNVVIALAVVFTPRVSRVVRSVSLSIKEMPYVDAARAIGASNNRIMLRHVLPNTFASLMVISTSLVGSAILIEASLSFLGVGMPSNIISWGSMLSGENLLHFASAPWVGLFPGFALTVVVFGINMFGDALRDTLDPKLRGR